MALRRIASPDAIPILVEQLDNYNQDVARSVAKALGNIGEPSTIKELVAAFNKIDPSDLDKKNYKEDIILALTWFKHPDAYAEIRRLNLLNHKNADIRRVVSQLLSKEDTPNIEDSQQQTDTYKFLEASEFPESIKFNITNAWQSPSYTINDFVKSRKLADIYGNAKEQRLLLAALNTPASLERNYTLLKLATSPDINSGIRVKAIETLSTLNDKKTLSILNELKQSSIPSIKAAALSKLNHIQHNLDQSIKMAADTSLALSTREQEIKAIVNFASKNFAKQEILRLAQQNEDKLSSITYRLVGDLQIVKALPLLEERLKVLDDQHHKWRSLRDNKPNTPTDADIKNINEEKSKIHEEFAFDYGYTISRLDPKRGLELLSHNLADVRQGAYMGFAMQANIKSLDELDIAREKRIDDSIFSYEAFHAIDLGLRRLEILGKAEEIKELGEWLKHKKSKDEVYQRLDWTIKTMKNYQMLEKEFKDKYNLVRVWPEGVLPVNQPYPAQP